MMSADLSEARRLLDSGFRLVELLPFSKIPKGERWNQPENFAKAINPEATGYGMPLAANKLCSIDPDRWDFACIGMMALGFDLEKLMAAGVRTRSTRPGSGGRSTFAADGGIGWLRFNGPETGVVLEFRADSLNLQDCVPGLVYCTKDGIHCTQAYASDSRYKLDEAPPLPDELLEWWDRCSSDRDFLNHQQQRFFGALGTPAVQSVSVSKPKSGKIQLAYPSPCRVEFNERHSVEEILERHGYQFHPREHRWSPPTATGAPGVRPIPGKDNLWQSDHASDPLSGTFDAWVASVVLDHRGDVVKARAAFDLEMVGPHSSIDLHYSPDTRAKQPSPIAHPLANFIDINGEVRPPHWLIHGFIAEGITVLSGQAGIGKTTALVPLSLVVAHVCEEANPLRPKHWRHVIYISEDPEQVKRVLAGLRDHPTPAINLHGQQLSAGSPKINPKDLAERFHLVEARRLAPETVIDVGAIYKGKFVRNVDGVELLPLVIFDTKAATIALEDENNNSEASKAIALLKQRFERLPVWIVGHISKTLNGINAARNLSMRGAGAFEADAHQTLYLVEDGTERFIVLGKHRFEPTWSELRVVTHTAKVFAQDQFGETVTLTLRWGLPQPPDAPRIEIKAKAAENLQLEEGKKCRDRMLEIVEKHQIAGTPLNRTALCKLTGGRKGDAVANIEVLLADGWLHEVTISAKMRRMPSRGAFLIRLSPEVRDTYLATGKISASLTAIPPSWRKEEISASGTEGEPSESAEEAT